MFTIIIVAAKHMILFKKKLIDFLRAVSGYGRVEQKVQRGLIYPHLSP